MFESSRLLIFARRIGDGWVGLCVRIFGGLLVDMLVWAMLHREIDNFIAMRSL